MKIPFGIAAVTASRIRLILRALERRISRHLHRQLRKLRGFAAQPSGDRDAEDPLRIVLGDGSVWSRLQDCPTPLLDTAALQIGPRLYLVGGFVSSGTVSDSIQVFDLGQRRWLPALGIPADLPQSHAAAAADAQGVIYLAGGQFGPHCSPALPVVYAFDTVSLHWQRLPDLPAARYAGTMQLWNGRLHFVGGADQDRWTPCADHWSLAVSGLAALEPGWRKETPIPVPGMHRCSAIVNGAFYVIGGQQGDFQAFPDSPDFTCNPATPETYLSQVFRLSKPDGGWQRLADLPIAVSHCDFSRLVIGDRIYLYGGQIHKDPQDSQLRLTNAIQAYDTTADRWSIAGYTPDHLKTPGIGHHDGAVVMVAGQRAGTGSHWPGPISARTWLGPTPETRDLPKAALLQALAGKRVLLVSHELDRTGAPLELLELGEAMIQSGAEVRLVNLSPNPAPDAISAEFRVPLVPPETALAQAGAADLVIVNTTHARTANWVRAGLETLPDLPGKLIWLVHEIDTQTYGPSAPLLRLARAATFDSAACRNAWGEIGGLPGIAVVNHPGLRDSLFLAATQPRQVFIRARSNLPSRSPLLLTRAEIRAELGIGPKDIVILSIGSVAPHKGQDMLLRSVARAAKTRGLPLRLLLAGFRDETQKRDILANLDDDGRKVFDRALGYLPTPHIDALCLASDLHVLNSQGANGRGETFGRATVHAMSFGLPVLGTRAGGTPEILEDGVHGFLYPIGEAGQEVLIDRIAQLASDPDLRLRMGQAAARHARARFTKDIYLKNFNDLLESHKFPIPPAPPPVAQDFGQAQI